MKKALLYLSVLTLFFACKKDQFSDDASLQVTFSQDTLVFDTLFVTMGSSTHEVRIKNLNSHDIVVDHIRIANGANSLFRLNVDGQSGDVIENIPIRAGDSIYAFVELTIDPSVDTLPFIIEDQLLVSVNSDEEQKVELVAWGQNAHFHYGNYLSAYVQSDTTWTNDLPHVIYGTLWVDSAATLNIEPGTSVHLHNNAILSVYRNGKILANGNIDNPITFEGTRLEPSYEEVSGQWSRIWISNESYGNEFNHCIIKNGDIGIQVDMLSIPTGHTMTKNLTINNTIIRNMRAVGIFARAGHIEMNNCVVSNCGQYLTAFTFGGIYTVRHSTLVNYWNNNYRETPAFHVDDRYQINQSTVFLNNLDSCYVGNSIIHGALDNELSVAHTSDETFFNASIIKTLIKVDNDYDLSDNSIYQSYLNNTTPGFVDNYDFHLIEGSSCINYGDPNITSQSFFLSTDIEEVSRATQSDIGAYQYNP